MSSLNDLLHALGPHEMSINDNLANLSGELDDTYLAISDAQTYYRTFYTDGQAKPPIGAYSTPNVGSYTTSALTLNRLYYIPIVLQHPQTTYDAIFCELTTAAGTTANIRYNLFTMGLTADGSPTPGDRIFATDVNTATSSGTATGLVGGTTPSTLTPGAPWIYYLAVVAQGADGGSATWRAINTATEPGPHHPGTAITGPTRCFFQAGVTGAIPATPTTPSPTIVAPLVLMRRSA